MHTSIYAYNANWGASTKNRSKTNRKSFRNRPQNGPKSVPNRTKIGFGTDLAANIDFGPFWNRFRPVLGPLLAASWRLLGGHSGIKSDQKSIFGGPQGSLGVPGALGEPRGTKGSDLNPKNKFWLGSAVRDFSKNFENVGALVGSLGRPGGPGKLWRQSLLNKDLAQTPQRGRESTDPVPKRADFSDTRATKKKSENVGPLVGSLARPGGPGKLWGQSLLNKDLAQTPQRGRESTDPVPKRADFSDTRATKKKSENVGPLVGSLARPGGPGKLWGQSLLNKDLAQTPESQNSRGGGGGGGGGLVDRPV